MKGAMGAFPENFLWGASLSGHQAEGENFASDWWRWEQRPGRIAKDHTSERAAGVLHRYVDDLELARQFGHNAFLFSLEWSRIQPEPDEFDEQALAHYARVFETLRKLGLEPICVLHHVTLPRWFAEEYGWHHRDAPALFGRYAEHVAKAYAPHCRWWIPVREPMHWITMAYLYKRWPRPRGALRRARLALVNLARAHAAGYRALHARRDDALVGPAVHARRFMPADENSPWDVRAKLREERRSNRLYLDAIVNGKWPLAYLRDRTVQNTADFIGVSYYGRERVRFALAKPSRVFAQTVDAAGKAVPPERYESDPEGFADILRELSEYDRPLIVTGNGLATDDDKERCAYLLQHAGALRRALDEGVDLRGYVHRALVDGFEWENGYTRRYGLIHVDRKTQSRTPNPSAFLYKELCRTGTISPGAVARYCPEAATQPESASP